ncbi:response regulator transcription factor [Eisenbergiella sp.]
MYSVLIVDDEKMIRDDVYGLLSMEESLELDLTTAASGVEAQAILEKRKIDIVIMDINMPQMSGLELYDIVRERWPFCKVIFLTGYSDFDYVYKVHKHAKYVLKAEEDEKILEALRESVEEIENSLLLERLTDLQREQQKKPLLHERSMFLRELFEGYRSLSQLTGELSVQLGINLDPEKEVYYLLLRHEAWYCENYQEQQNATQDCYQLLERYFLDFMRGTFFEYNKNYIVLLLQPEKLLHEETIVKMLAGAGELFQKALKKNLGRTVSILVGERPVTLSQLLQEFIGMCDRMIWLSGEELVQEGLQKEALAKETLPENKKQELMQMLWRLEYYLEGMEEENSLNVLRQLQTELQSVKSMHDLFALEAYCTISSRLIGWIKRLELHEELAFRVGTLNLYNVSMHANWQDAFGYLRHVAESIFSLKNQSVEKQTEDVVNQVKKYIVEHLDGDTSLYNLAEQVHFSQEYLLRIFKKKEGITILSYINDLKLTAAKQLLTDSELQVKEIADRLGFASQGYFGRFFRNKTGLTPNAYREAEKRKK